MNQERQRSEITHLKWTSFRWTDRAQAAVLAKRVKTKWAWSSNLLAFT